MAVQGSSWGSLVRMLFYSIGFVGVCLGFIFFVVLTCLLGRREMSSSRVYSWLFALWLLLPTCLVLYVRC